MAYNQFIDDEGLKYGSFEVYLVTPEGWFWRACFPGCLPDGEPFGPFPTEAAAENDAICGGT
jgi:hypothetical protein